MKSFNKNIIDIKLPSKQAFTIPTDDDFLQLHTLMVINGRRGSGKTLSLCNFLRVARDKHYFDKIFCITPSYNSNKEILDIAYIKEEDVFEPSVSVISELIKIMEVEKLEYDQFILSKEKYKKFKKQMNNKSKISDDELLEYMDMNFFDMEVAPKWKYPVEQPPRFGLVLDDCLNTDVLARRSSGLVNLCIQHRHKMDGLGLSVFMLCQSLICNGGVPRIIRENLCHLLLFKINDEKQIEKIKQECDLPITDDEFRELLNICHEEDHQFLLIDFAPKCKAKMFRKGFNEIIVPKSLEHKCKCKIK